MSKWQKFLYSLRVKLIKLLSGEDLAVITNITLSGVVYPRAKYLLITSNFVMGNLDIRTEDTEEVHDQVNVDSGT